MLANSGKFESLNHYEARQDMLTAGKAVRILRKLGFPVNAQQIKPFADEWHHAGYIRKFKSMGRTFFFHKRSEEEWRRLGERILSELNNLNETGYFFCTDFRRSCGRWIPVASFRQMTMLKFETMSRRMQGKFTEISEEDYHRYSKYAGEDLESYETFEEFKKRMDKKGSEQ